MSLSKIEYLVSNGNFCVEFLEALAESESDASKKNRILNHAIAVGSLCACLKDLRNEYSKCRIALNNSEYELQELRRGLYKKYVAGELEKMKADLIDHIKEYGGY